jgi:glycerol-3-phosphate cytidylyltransferase
LHVGHVRILQRAAALGERLVVGVSSDALNFRKKGKNAVYSEEERMEIISAMGCVDEVFLEEALEKKALYVQQYGADILVMGDDWKGKFDDNPCEVLYLERTPLISTTEVVSQIKAD